MKRILFVLVTLSLIITTSTYAELVINLYDRAVVTEKLDVPDSFVTIIAPPNESVLIIETKIKAQGLIIIGHNIIIRSFIDVKNDINIHATGSFEFLGKIKASRNINVLANGDITTGGIKKALLNGQIKSFKINGIPFSEFAENLTPSKTKHF